MHEGIDIASFQHPGGAAINYRQTADALRARGGGLTPFVFVKIIEGLTYINPWWRADVIGFANVDVAVGGYIFDLGLTSPAAEEAHARALVGPGLPLVVDAETPQGLSPVAYGQHMAAVVGYEPIKVEYLNQSQVAAGELHPGDELWLADYSTGSPHHACLVDQYSDVGTVAGIAGHVDVNRWYGTEAEFADFFHRGTITPTPTPSGGGMTPLTNGIDFAWTPTGKGYWEVQTDGGVFTHGDAPFLGSLGGRTLAKPIVAIASHPTKWGYWLAGADGGVFTFGDVAFYGSLGGVALAQPVTDLHVTPTGNGYALVASDGGFFTFGDAVFAGAGQ